MRILPLWYYIVMKKRTIYIGVLVLVLIGISVLGIKSSIDRQSRISKSGISDILQTNDGTNASSTLTGGGTTLGVRTVDEKVAYTRIQSEWIWTKTTYTNPSFAPSGPSKGKDFILTLNEDKTLSITGDCNAIKGSYTLSQNTVSGLETEDEMALGTMSVKVSASTKKYCEWSKETSFMKDLSKVSAYDMRNNLLSLTLADGQGYIVFRRNLEVEG